MAYNCTNWKTKRLSDFRVPVASLFKHDRSDWRPERINHDDGSVTFRMMECVSISGTILDDWLHVTEVQCSGEGSGTAMNLILEPAFEDSRGLLVACCVWEGGDCINRLTVEEGIVVWTDIDV